MKGHYIFRDQWRRANFGAKKFSDLFSDMALGNWEISETVEGVSIWTRGTIQTRYLFSVEAEDSREAYFILKTFADRHEKQMDEVQTEVEGSRANSKAETQWGNCGG